MNPKTLLPLLLAASLTVTADTAEDNLMSAQSVYRNILNSQNNNDGKIISLQSQLEDARQRLQKAQADIDRLQTEIQTAMETKAQQSDALKQAGEKMDAAWNAVYGIGGTKNRQP